MFHVIEYTSIRELSLKIYIPLALIWYASLMTFTLTGFGFATLQTYNRALKQLEKYGRIDDVCLEKWNAHYCDRIGLNLARNAPL